ncbi:MAG: phosphodiester glycosidase family protein [Anaerolineales bacterium]
MKSKTGARPGSGKNIPIHKSKIRRSRWQRIGWGVVTAGVAGILALVLAFVAVNTWPVLGAEGADLLRNMIGDKAVAGLEMAFDQVQDAFQKLKYQLGLETPAAPWNSLPASVAAFTPTELFSNATAPSLATQPPPAYQPTGSLAGSETPEPTFTPTPVWPPAALAPLGSTPGEGIWSAYIQDAEGNSVAYRTFLEPDPTRPFAVVAVVAIDLTRTRLHFVLGTIEPAGTNQQPRTGYIPKDDRGANVLLAAFNGGFKARNGEFGAMADGVTALPPRDGLGTVMLYQDGTVRLGAWGTDVNLTPDVVAFRQNGPLVVQQGVINAQIYDNSPEDWGYTVKDVSPTVRSGIGLSKDNATLYYFCGPSLSMEMLAKSMQAAGAWNAIQLDINDYWVLFVKFQPSGWNLIPEALLPKLMVENLDRYLWNYSRDYFYVTGDAR